MTFLGSIPDLPHNHDVDVFKNLLRVLQRRHGERIYPLLLLLKEKKYPIRAFVEYEYRGTATPIDKVKKCISCMRREGGRVLPGPRFCLLSVIRY